MRSVLRFVAAVAVVLASGACSDDDRDPGGTESTTSTRSADDKHLDHDDRVANQLRHHGHDATALRVRLRAG
jgi:hypothetical protein